MSTVQKIIGGIAVIALILLSAFLLKGGSAPAQPAAPSLGATFSTNAPVGNSVGLNNVVLPNASTYDYLVARAYAFVKFLGLDNGTSVGTNIVAVRSSINASTSTVLCSITSPFTATSSILHTAINFTTAPTSTLSLVEGTTSAASNTAYATSSGILTASVLVSATNTPVAWDPSTNNDVIGPGGTITWGVGAASSQPWYNVAGACQALLMSDN